MGAGTTFTTSTTTTTTTTPTTTHMASATMGEDMVANETENNGAEAKVAGVEHSQRECNGDRPEAQCSVCGKLGHVAGDEECPLLRLL